MSKILVLLLSLLLVHPGCDEPEAWPDEGSVSKKTKKRPKRSKTQRRKTGKKAGKADRQKRGKKRRKKRAGSRDSNKKSRDKTTRRKRSAEPASGPKKGRREASERSRGSQVGLLTKATAFVFTPTSIGSGFFVAPGVLVTNAHVVGGARRDKIWVASSRLGKARQAKLIAKTRSKSEGDYAILRVPKARGVRALPLLRTLVRPLAKVVAAGYPGLVVETDAKFRKLKSGDMTAVPGLVFSSGEVSVVQNAETIPLVAHTAKISGGNSGGPLVDQCGRVVGINTFIRYEKSAPSLYSYALASKHLLRFLRKHGIEPARSTRTRCEADR